MNTDDQQKDVQTTDVKDSEDNKLSTFKVVFTGVVGAFSPQILRWYSQPPDMGIDPLELAGSALFTLLFLGLAGWITLIWSVRNLKEAFIVGLGVPYIVLSLQTDIATALKQSPTMTTSNITITPADGSVNSFFETGRKTAHSINSPATNDVSVADGVLDSIIGSAFAAAANSPDPAGFVRVADKEPIQRFFQGFTRYLGTSSSGAGLGYEWQLLPGSARDIGIGADGSVWLIGTNPVAGGHGIFRWNGTAWNHVSGGAERIAVDPDGNPWVVNSDSLIFRRINGEWQRQPGSARDIGIGADGSVWVIGTNPVAGGYGIYRWNGTDWNSVNGGAERIAVDPDGNPWVVNSDSLIFQRINGEWKRQPGSARDIGIGADGSVWVIGTNPVAGGYGIYRWSGVKWFGVAGGAVAVSVGPRGLPWVINNNDRIFQRL